jgi:uncharacterized membrane protein
MERSPDPERRSNVVNLFYNRFAGKSLDRVAALSDGVFAFAMTLLVLDLHVPAMEGVRSEHDLWAALLKLAPRLVPYAMTLLLLGIFWVGQQTQLNAFQRADRNLAWITIAFLFVVTLTPFSTALLASFIQYRTALLIYWFNVLLLGLMLAWSWRYAMRAGLVKADVPPEMGKSLMNRIVVAQSLYAFGAALCAINTYWSIGFMLLVQLNYAIAPRLGFLYRL